VTNFRENAKSFFARASYYSLFLHLFSKGRFWADRYVRVLNLHGTPECFADRFRQYLKWTKKKFAVLTPDQFKAFLLGRLNIQRPGILFTFDDGCSDNYAVAAPILEEFDLRGIFFVSPGLLEGARVFGGSINPKLEGITRKIRERESKGGGRMSLEQIARLARRGHEIGYHTYSHSLINDLPEDVLSYDYCFGKETLEKSISKEVESFAWPYSYCNLDKGVYDLLRTSYRYCFLPISGVSFAGQNPFLIFRTNVEIGYPPFLYRAMLLGIGDAYWYFKKMSIFRDRGIK